MSDFLILHLPTGTAELCAEASGRPLATMTGVTRDNADDKLHEATGRRLSPRGHWHESAGSFTTHIVALRGA